MSDSEPVSYTINDGIVTIAINRPERKNALSVEAMNGLTDAWERVEQDTSASVVILTSADCGVFSAGLDLKQAAEIRARDGVDILTLMRDPMQTAMREVYKADHRGDDGIIDGGRNAAGDQVRSCGSVFAEHAPGLPRSRWGGARRGRCRCCGCCRSRC